MSDTNTSGAAFVGQRPTFTALPNWIRGKVNPYQLAVLWALQSHYPVIRPSLALLATEAGVSKRKAQQVVNELVEMGWLIKETRVSASGDKDPNVYQLNIWGGDPRGMAPDATGVEHDMPRGIAPRAIGVWHDVPQGMAPHAHKEEQEKKNNSRRTTKNTPLPPQEGEETIEDQPAKPAKAPADPYSRKVLPENAIPNDLLDLQELLPEWWSVKKGTRSAKVFMRVCNRVRIWTQEQRRLALESAIASGWADIYEPRTPSAASSRPRNPDGSIMTECQKAIAHMDLHQAAVADFLLAHPDADANSLPSAWQTIR